MSESNGHPLHGNSLFTPEVRARILAAVRSGNYLSVAVKGAGIGRRTLNDWLQAGKRQPESEYGVFRKALMEAEALAEIEALGFLSRAAREGDVKALTFWLSTKHPSRWSQQRDKVRQLERKLEELEKRLGPAPVD